MLRNSKLADLFSLDNSHNGVDMAKATVLGCDVLCLKRGNYFLLTVHASPTQEILSCMNYLAYLHIFVRRGRRSNTDI